MFESRVSKKYLSEEIAVFLPMSGIKQVSEHVEAKKENRRHLVALSVYQARNDPPHAIPAVL